MQSTPLRQTVGQHRNDENPRRRGYQPGLKPSLPLTVIRVPSRPLMQQRDTGDHLVSARRPEERAVTGRTDQARDTNGDSKP
jgi:hypothetical protein